MATSAIQRAAENKPVSGRKTIQGLMKSMEHEIAKALPSMLTAERFMRRLPLRSSTSAPRRASWRQPCRRHSWAWSRTRPSDRLI